MSCASPSQPQGEAEELQIENPNSAHDEDNQNHQQEQKIQSQSSETQTLETLDSQSPEQSELDQTQNQQQQDLQVLGQEGDQHHHQEPGDRPEQSGMSTISPPPTLAAPIADPHDPNPPRRPNKRKKLGNKKKQQAIEKKLQTLTQNLKSVPFVPSKILDFDKHERLLKRLGLWDFVHIEFDSNIRVDLIAQLIVTYDARSRCSYVNEFRIAVNRAALARAFKLSVKKDKGNASALSSEAVDFDLEALSEDSIAFIEDFVSNWMLLHEDTWMMPSEVLNWTRTIKEGHCEKVDWAGLIWFMVEKELLQGKQLEDCYYASHLQCLIKSQREEVFWEEPKVEVKEEEDVEEPKVVAEVEEEEGGEEPKVEEELELKEEGVGEERKVEAEFEVKEEDVGEEPPKVEAVFEVVEEEDCGEVKMAGSDDFGEHDSHDDIVVEEPNVILTLGQEIVEKEEVKDGDMMDTEESKEVQGHWLLDGKNSMGDHFLQPCNMEDDRGMVSDEERKPEEEEDEEEEDDGFNLTPRGHTLENDGLTGNLLQRMETTQLPFSLPGQLRDQSDMELLASRTETHTSSGGPSVFVNASKRGIDHEHDISHESLNGSNKRLRTDGLWGHKSSDFEMCIEQVHHWMGEARMLYVAKEQACEESNMSQQIYLSELQRRDLVIEQLQKTKCEELQRKDGEIYRLERELFVMGNVLDGYRKALKETHKAFSEYRQRCQLHEEPLYKDAGPGGVVLSTMELEKQRLKQEEEDRLNCILIEQKAKEFEEEFLSKLEAHFNEVQKLDKLLMNFENEVKLLKELSAKRKVSETSELHQMGD